MPQTDNQNKEPAPNIRILIAQRTLTRTAPPGQVHIYIYRPEPEFRTSGFQCHFQIDHLSGEAAVSQSAWGTDSLHSIQEALQHIRKMLAPHEDHLRWHEDQWLGFSRPLPGGVAPEFDRHFERLIEREHRQLQQELLRERRETFEPADVDRMGTTDESISHSRIASNTDNKKPGSILIAERLFDWSDGRGQVCAAVLNPEPDPASGDFRCRFTLSGLPRDARMPLERWGIDSLQALSMAIQGVGTTLYPFRHQLRWNGSYWLGLPLMLTSGLGSEIDSRLERLVDRELERLAQHPRHSNLVR